MRCAIPQSGALLEQPFQLREKLCGKDREATSQDSLYSTKTAFSIVSERLYGRHRSVASVKITMTFVYPIKMIQLHGRAPFSRKKDSPSFLAERSRCGYDLPLQSGTK